MRRASSPRQRRDLPPRHLGHVGVAEHVARSGQVGLLLLVAAVALTNWLASDCSLVMRGSAMSAMLSVGEEEVQLLRAQA